MMDIGRIINLERYPLDALESDDGLRMIAGIRADLEEDGSCTLESFVRPEARERMAEEADSLVELGFPGPTEVTPYFFNYRIGQDLETDESHPTRRKGRRNLRQVATDLIPADHILSTLFHTPLMTDFLGRVLDKPVFQYRDKYQSLNISVMDAGGCQQWHFDSGQLVTTLLLQAPESGGIFEYAPRVRSDEDENFEEVRKVLDGTSRLVRKIQPCEGSLNLFQGHYSLHRVTEVEGRSRRIQAILAYVTNPEVRGSIESSILHYGPRIARLERGEAPG